MSFDNIPVYKNQSNPMSWAEVVATKNIPNQAIYPEGLVFTTRLGIKYPVIAITYECDRWFVYTKATNRYYAFALTTYTKIESLDI